MLSSGCSRAREEHVSKSLEGEVEVVHFVIQREERVANAGVEYGIECPEAHGVGTSTKL